MLQNKDVNSVLVGQADAPADAQADAQANAQASDFIKQNYATATGERSALGEKQNNDSKSAQTNQESRNVLELDRPTSGALASSEDFRSESAAPLGGSVSSNLYGGSLLLSQLTGLTNRRSAHFAGEYERYFLQSESYRVHKLPQPCRASRQRKKCSYTQLVSTGTDHLLQFAAHKLAI